MKHKIAIISSLFVLLFTLQGCDSYQQILRSNDYNLKERKANEYYEAGSYQKAIPLLEELLRIRKGARNIEELYYKYCQAHFGIKDYLLSAHYFSTFAQTYPSSIYAEEAQFRSALSYYKMSPKASLDQTYTEKAIAALQRFVNNYPNSDKVQECNQIIDEARVKLEEKAFNGAMLYYRIKDYRAAVTSLENVVLEFPDTKRATEIQFLILKAHYLLAENSIPSKQQERYEAVVDAYLSLIDKYPKNGYIREAERIYQDSINQLKRIKS